MSNAQELLQVDGRGEKGSTDHVAQSGVAFDRHGSEPLVSLNATEAGVAPALDSSSQILTAVSKGHLSMLEAARQLALPDAGHVLRGMANSGLLPPRLPDELLCRQARAARKALDACFLIPDTPKQGVRNAIPRRGKA